MLIQIIQDITSSFITDFRLNQSWSRIKELLKRTENKYKLAIVVDMLCLLLVLSYALPISRFISPIGNGLSPLTQNKSDKEVFGFAPYWTFSNLDNVDFSTLTTLSYFGVPVNSDGTLDKTDPGYTTFQSSQATSLFRKAHQNGTRVVLTLTQMDNSTILALMASPQAQQEVISEAVSEVKTRGIDGLNVDFEYLGDPGPEYRTRFSTFITNLSKAMHQSVPHSKVSVSVYASAIKDPKIYDIASIGKSADNIFMMAYDYATSSSDTAMPTAPLGGYKEGKYWYDVQTAVTDFLTEMPANKLILGVPWYGYDYVVYNPGVNAETRPSWTWRGQPQVDTYAVAENSIKVGNNGITNVTTGWDSVGQVGWKAYYDSVNGTWRMIFLEDAKSLGLKYDFVKKENLAGVGIWALGFDKGTTDMWSLLRDKFGIKLADSSVVQRGINDENIN